MSVRSYDPSQVVVTVNGAQMSGFADGTFVSVIRSNDAFTKVTGADGVTSRSKSSDKSGELTITLAQTSPSNDILSALATLDELSSLGVVAIAVKDISGRSLFASGNAWIRKVPDSAFGKEIDNREWVFDCADLAPFVGGNGSLT